MHYVILFFDDVPTDTGQANTGKIGATRSVLAEFTQTSDGALTLQAPPEKTARCQGQE